MVMVVQATVSVDRVHHNITLFGHCLAINREMIGSYGETLWCLKLPLHFSCSETWPNKVFIRLRYVYDDLGHFSTITLDMGVCPSPIELFTGTSLSKCLQLTQ